MVKFNVASNIMKKYLNKKSIRNNNKKKKKIVKKRGSTQTQS